MKYNYKIKNESSGTPILLLHGWGGTVESLKALQEELAKEISNPIYNLELAGMGSSEMTKEIMDTGDYADFVIEFLRSQNIEKVILLGHSFGGKISIHIASRNLFPLEKLILIASSGIKPENSLKKQASKFLIKLVPQKFKDNKLLKEFFYKGILNERDYLNAGLLKASLSKVVEEHYDDELQKIKTSTLIIWGENDSYVPVWMGRKINQQIANSKLIVVPEVTHNLPIKSPVLVAEIISNFIKQI